MFDEAVAGLQVKDVAAVEQAVTDEQRRRHVDVVAAIAPKFTSPPVPDDLLGSLSDARRSDACSQPDSITYPQSVAFDLATHAFDDAHRARSGLPHRPPPSRAGGHRDRVAATAAVPRDPTHRPGCVAAVHRYPQAGSSGARPARRSHWPGYQPAAWHGRPPPPCTRIRRYELVP